MKIIQTITGILNRFRGWIGLGGLLTLAVVALMPWQARYISSVGDLAGIPWEQGTVSLYATEVMILAALLCHVIGRPARPASELRKPPAHFLLWAVFLIFGLASAAWAREPVAAIFAWIRLVEGFALAWLVVQGRFGLRAPAVAFVLGNVPGALLGLSQFLAQRSFASTLLGLAAHPAAAPGAAVVETAAGRWLRAYGSLPHPNVFGAFMAAALVLAVALAVSSEAVRVRRCWIFLSVVFLTALAVSFSRSAWLAAAVVFPAAFGCRRFWNPEARSRFRRTAAVLLATAAFLALALWPIASTRLAAAGRLETQSLSERALSLNQGVQLFWANPEIGVGLGNFQPAAWGDTEPRYDDPYRYQPAHLVPLLAAAELGVFGALLLVGAAWLWFIEARGFRRLLSEPLAQAALYLPLVAIVAGLLDHWPLTAYAGILLTGTLFGLSARAASDTPASY